MSNEKIRQQNIEKVLKQAMKLFVENGIENTSTEMIARASDLTLRSVQNYFHTKNDLYTAVLNRGYAIEFSEIKAYFESEKYINQSGADQIIGIITTTFTKAVKYPEIVLCTSQLQNIITKAYQNLDKLQATEKWQYMMDQMQKAFDKGATDGSIAQTTYNDLADVKTVMLGMLGAREKIAYAMCNQTLRELFDPEKKKKKYIRQVELIFKA